MFDEDLSQMDNAALLAHLAEVHAAHKHADRQLRRLVAAHPSLPTLMPDLQDTLDFNAAENPDWIEDQRDVSGPGS
jgi:hypothetical protein